MVRAEGKIRISMKHRYRLILFQMRLGIWNNISHAGILRCSAHFPRPCLSRSLCLPSSLAAQFYILLHQLLIDENQRQICTTAFSFMFVPFVPIPPLPLPPSHHPFPSLPSASPKDGKNFNDSSEDSRDLIGNCDCHSKDLGLFGRRKGERSGIEGQEEKERKILVLFKQKKWTGFCIY